MVSNKIRIQRKAKEKEIRRLQNLLDFSKLDIDDELFIKNNIEYLKNELGYFK